MDFLLKNLIFNRSRLQWRISSKVKISQTDFQSVKERSETVYVHRNIIQSTATKTIATFLSLHVMPKEMNTGPSCACSKFKILYGGMVTEANNYIWNTWGKPHLHLQKPWSEPAAVPLHFQESGGFCDVILVGYAVTFSEARISAFVAARWKDFPPQAFACKLTLFQFFFNKTKRNDVLGSE